MRDHAAHERGQGNAPAQALDMVTAQVVTDGSSELENAILRQRLNEAHAALKRVWELAEQLKALGPNENEQDPYDLGQEFQETVGEAAYQQMMHAPRPDEVSILKLLDDANAEYMEAMRSPVGVVSGSNQYRINRAKGVLMGLLRVKAMCDGITLHSCPVCGDDVQVNRRVLDGFEVNAMGTCGHRFVVQTYDTPADKAPAREE
jgi:hypothetical protein